MADERKVKVIHYEVLWKALRWSLTEVLCYFCVFDSDDEFRDGLDAAYHKVLSLMRSFEDVYEEAE